MDSSCPSLLIAAPQGRSGKTTLSLGLCAHLNKQGFLVQAFKKGPDYIDPSWLSAASGRPCRTLDPFIHHTDNHLRDAFLSGINDADITVIEGNHGLFDSVFEDGAGSSAAVARVLHVPIILVVNTARMSRSVAAMIHGYQTFEKETPIKAVVLNNVAGKRHLTKLRTAIETYCSIPVVGAIPRDPKIVIPDRHLGLIPHAEGGNLTPVIEACRSAVRAFVDIEKVLEIAQYGSQMIDPVSRWEEEFGGSSTSSPILGVIRDSVFSFYYPENLDALERLGAKLVFIDSLHDKELPTVDALYIGGGFPEIFMDELESNSDLRESVRTRIEAGLPVYAECGGLMYLSKRISWGGKCAEMVGALPCEVELSERPQGHGYILAEVSGKNPFFPQGTTLRGHEFHNSRLKDFNGACSTAYRLLRGSGIGDNQDGIVFRNILASYTHLHSDGSPGWAEGLVSRAKEYAQERSDG